MKTTNRIIHILDTLSKTYPDAKCMLDYNKDYELVIAVMLSAQTTDVAVNKVTAILFNRYKTVQELSYAQVADIYEIVKKLGLAAKKSQNVVEIAKIISNQYDGRVPNSEEKLSRLPGVGRKTINVILSELFNEDRLAVDTHVSRLAIRMGFANNGDDAYAIEQKLLKVIPCGNRKKAHHLLIRHGRTICKAKGFDCSSCPINSDCKKII